jgi:hypothetical protein
MSRDESIRAVEGSGRDALEKRCKRPGEAGRSYEIDDPGPVAGAAPVRERDAPRRVTLLIRERREQAHRSQVAEAEERELVPAIECGDDPRRPAAEASFVVVEEDGARDLLGHARYAAEGLPAGVKSPSTSSVLGPVFSTMWTWRGRSRNADPSWSSSTRSPTWSRAGPSGIQTISS